MNIIEEAAVEYDEWFETHKWVYQSEVEAVRKFMPETGKGIEIGVGTGRFFIPFGIKVGVEPARAMAENARKRGITVYQAKDENLPFFRWFNRLRLNRDIWYDYVSLHGFKTRSTSKYVVQSSILNQP